MRAWRLVGVAAALAAGAAGGCSDPPPTIHTARPVGGDDADAEKPVDAGPAPAKSDPAAAAVVKAAVDAHTGGKPELLGPLKAVTFERRGPVTGGGTDPVVQTWFLDTQWPDKCRIRAEIPRQPAIAIGWTGAAGWRHAQNAGRVPMTPQEVKDFQLDATGDWLTLVFPLAEPDLIVAAAADTVVNNKPAAGVRVWHPALSPAVLHFDKATKLLARVEFEGREFGKKVTKEVRVAESRPLAGVTIPVKTVVRLNGNVLAEWTITELKPAPSPDPKVFENP